MLLRRHKINTARQGNPNNIVEDTQQEELYGDELQYKPAKTKEQENEEEKPYTKTEINRMSKESLGILAREVGIDSPEEISGSELKKMLIQHFNL